ncbi:MAG: hypothetical protein AB2665_02575 [Candidatus Thiodiazotropha sp.]
MNRKILKTVNSDRVILVSSKKLMEHADKADLECRNSIVIEDLYHKDWFFNYNDESYFTPPAIYINDGKILFVNGRHRAILFARHLEEFPILVSNLDMDHSGGCAKESSLAMLEKIKSGEIHEHSYFNLPELEFGDFPPA